MFSPDLIKKTVIFTLTGSQEELQWADLWLRLHIDQQSVEQLSVDQPSIDHVFCYLLSGQG
jgi:hypothetical protein